jgi:hypothetical protein
VVCTRCVTSLYSSRLSAAAVHPSISVRAIPTRPHAMPSHTQRVASSPRRIGGQRADRVLAFRRGPGNLLDVVAALGRHQTSRHPRLQSTRSCACLRESRASRATGHRTRRRPVILQVAEKPYTTLTVLEDRLAPYLGIGREDGVSDCARNRRNTSHADALGCADTLAADAPGRRAP